MAEIETVNRTEFARQVGKSRQWITKKINDGTLPVDENGMIYLAEGLAIFEDMAKRAEARKALLKKPAKNNSAPTTEAMSGVMNVTAAFNKARLAEKTYQAKLKEIEYKLKKGELIESEKVRADAHATASALRSRLASIPVRISGLCEGRPAREIEEIIEDAINDALTEFQKSEFLTDDGAMG